MSFHPARRRLRFNVPIDVHYGPRWPSTATSRSLNDMSREPSALSHLNVNSMGVQQYCRSLGCSPGGKGCFTNTGAIAECRSVCGKCIAQSSMEPNDKLVTTGSIDPWCRCYFAPPPPNQKVFHFLVRGLYHAQCFVWQSCIGRLPCGPNSMEMVWGSALCRTRDCCMILNVRPIWTSAGSFLRGNYQGK